MGELYFVAEDPTINIPRYASRISQKSWHRYRPLVQRLHDKGLTRREILSDLSKHQFHPSFGQLVAQMTKWRLVRYSKPMSTPTPPISKPTAVPSAPGIMGVSSILLAVEPVTSILPQDDSTWAGTSYELSQLISDLRITSDTKRRTPDGSPDNNLCSSSYSLQRRRELLDAADMLFLGGSYAHACHTYRDVYKLPIHPQASLEESLDEEQLQVQGIIGCLKSSATDEQREESIITAQRFLDGLEEWCEENLTPPSSMEVESSTLTTSSPASQPQSSPSLSTRIRTAFDTWHSYDFAVSKAVFDLLTRYKQSRAIGIIPPEVSWSHRVTMHEWMCMRLVRLPTWQDAITFRFPGSLQSLSALSLSSEAIDQMPQLGADPIFEPDNLTAIFEWTVHALQECGAWYDEQASILRTASTSTSSSSSTLSSFQALLFWRLAFFSKHSLTSCPELRVRLSPDVVFVAGSLQTASVISHILLSSNASDSSLHFDNSAAANRTAHLHLLEDILTRLALQAGSADWIFTLLWAALKNTLAPSFDQRCQS